LPEQPLHQIFCFDGIASQRQHRIAQEHLRFVLLIEAFQAGGQINRIPRTVNSILSEDPTLPMTTSPV